MQITETMDLNELNARTQNEMSTEEIGTLRDLLCDSGYDSTEEIGEAAWLHLLERAVEQTE